MGININPFKRVIPQVEELLPRTVRGGYVGAVENFAAHISPEEIAQVAQVREIRGIVEPPPSGASTVLSSTPQHIVKTPEVSTIKPTPHEVAGGGSGGPDPNIEAIDAAISRYGVELERPAHRSRLRNDHTSSAPDTPGFKR